MGSFAGSNLPEAEVHYEIKIGEESSESSDGVSQGGFTQPSPMSQMGRKDIFVSEFDGSMQGGITPMGAAQNKVNLPKFGLVENS